MQYGVWAEPFFVMEFCRVGSCCFKLWKVPILEIRANVARTIGDIGMKKAQSSLIKTLSDKSSRVRSMGAIALGRVADAGDTEACIALFNAVAKNQGSNFEVTLRHAYLSALSRLSTKDQLFFTSESNLSSKG